MTDAPRTRGSATFFVLTFAITGTLQLPALLAHAGLLAVPVEALFPLAGLGGLGPMLAAVLLIRREPGGSARALFRPLRPRRERLGWYVVALFLPGVLLAAGVAVARLVGDTPARYAYPPADAARVVAMVLFPLGEEIGWRGFALPRLEARTSRLSASLVLGAAWAVWHVPMFVLVDTPLHLYPVAFVFYLTGSVVFSWLYHRSGASLLVVVLAHAGAHLSNSGAALPETGVPFVAQTAAFVLLAVALTLADRTAWRSV